MGQKPIDQSQTKNQQQILSQCGQIIKQLHLEQTQSIFLERRHLLARISIYGHQHLITQLKKLQTLQDKKKFIRYLKNIDFQTIDLLFHKIVRNSLLEEKQKYTYHHYQYFDKRKLTQQNISLYQKDSQFILQNCKIAIILFMGGASTRFNHNIGKQIYKQNQNQLSIFEVLIKQIQQFYDKGLKPTTYIICNQKNYKYLSNWIKTFKYSQLIIPCMQNTLPVVNLNGQICLKSQNYQQIIQMPNGCGDFVRCNVKFQKQTIIEDLKKKKIQYVYCSSCYNYYQKILDPFLLGYLYKNKNQYDVIFKCTYPQNQFQKFLRVVTVGQKQNIRIVDLQKLLNNCKQSQASIVRRSPIWMNTVLFKFDKFQQFLINVKSSQKFPQMFTAQKKRLTYWSPFEEKVHSEEYCYVFQRQLSDILINNQLKVKGIMVERQEQFMPVISLNDQHTWKDAYHYYYQKSKVQKDYYKISLMSKISEINRSSNNNEQQEDIIKQN